MLAAACPADSCDGYVNMLDLEVANTDDLKCSKCNSSISDEFLQQYKEVTEFSEMHLQSMKHTACILFLFSLFEALNYIFLNPIKI